MVDFGTATTFDVISSEGEYVGGVICPGHRHFGRGAVPARGAAAARRVRNPRVVIGQTTVDAMQSGLFFGYVEMVDGSCAHPRELADGEQAIVHCDGGLADVLSAETRTIQHVVPI